MKGGDGEDISIALTIRKVCSVGLLLLSMNYFPVRFLEQG